MRRAILALTTVLLTGCAVAPAPYVPHAVQPSAVPRRHLLIGVYEPDDPGSFRQVAGFAAATGVWPALIVYYSPWLMPFFTHFADEVYVHGGTPLVQIDPRHVSIAAIADGGQDAYLHSYARQVRAYGHPVIISFGQEMNGSWYPWGARLTPASVFVAAWRHIVRTFHAEGARNVIWLWDVNCNFPGSRPDRDWWPGAAYVTWVGMDCYYINPSSTFKSRFGSALSEIRQFTSAPLLVAETAAGPLTGNVPRKITDLFASAVANRLLGVIWFDQAQHDGPYHQDWRLEGNVVAIAAFRRAVERFCIMNDMGGLPEVRIDNGGTVEWRGGRPGRTTRSVRSPPGLGRPLYLTPIDESSTSPPRQR